MERTIDGIDYIAKSEVLRIIDEHIREARKHIMDRDVADITAYGWTCRLRSLHDIQFDVAEIKER